MTLALITFSDIELRVGKELIISEVLIYDTDKNEAVIKSHTKSYQCNTLSAVPSWHVKICGIFVVGSGRVVLGKLPVPRRPTSLD